jgi:uncharacterized membrane protein YphA (DoxX/SURF4 family)
MSFELALLRHANDPVPLTWSLILPRRAPQRQCRPEISGRTNPPELWVTIAAVSETQIGIALVLGICTRFAALGACALLLVAVYSLQVVKGFGWTCNTGGYEYPVFWTIVSLSVAIEAWKGHFAAAQVPASHPASWERAPLVH